MTPTIRRARLLAVLGLLCAVAAGSVPAAARPPILFVSRGRAAEPGATAGQGPIARAEKPGGALRVLDSGGGERPFLADGPAFFDVADPAVSWDGASVVFAAARSADDPFRLYVCDTDGRNVRPVTRPGDAPGEDFDPCWLPDGRIVFASTRCAQTNPRTGGPVTNLFAIHPDGSRLARITTDRYGAEEPAIDATGRILYARWWFNPYRPDDMAGVTTDPSAAFGERVDLWQTVSVTPDGEGVKLAAGNPRNRMEQMLYQAVPLPDGGIAGVNAADQALVPGTGTTRLAVFDPALGPLRALTPPGRCASPVLLDDRTILFSWCAGNGDLDLCTIDRRGGAVRTLLGRTGTDEVDAVPLVARPAPPALPAGFPPPLHAEAIADESVLHDGIDTFRFDCLNVFANGAVDAPIPNAPAADPDLRIRFYAALARPGAALGDSLVLVREAPVTRTGAVHEHDLPADVPMFEQLVDREGRVVRTSNGAAHVPGFNFVRIGAGTKCVGCHTGHSTLPVPKNYQDGTWFNAAPSAAVEASSSVPPTDPRALIDRRAAAPVEETGWIARGIGDEWVRLSWRFSIEARTLVVYPATQSRHKFEPAEDDVDIVLLREGRIVARLTTGLRLDSKGSRIELSPLIIDAVEIRPRGATGRLGGQPVVALSEIEVSARLVE